MNYLNCFLSSQTLKIAVEVCCFSILTILEQESFAVHSSNLLSSLSPFHPQL